MLAAYPSQQHCNVKLKGSVLATLANKRATSTVTTTNAAAASNASAVTSTSAVTSAFLTCRDVCETRQTLSKELLAKYVLFNCRLCQYIYCLSDSSDSES